MTASETHPFVDARNLVRAWGIEPSGVVYRNLDIHALYQASFQRGQAVLMTNGALLQDSTPYVGRSAKSSFYVRDPDFRTEDGRDLDSIMAWGDPAQDRWDNMPIAPAVFAKLKARMIEGMSKAGDLYVSDSMSGRTVASKLPVRVITTRPASALFSHNIFLRLSFEELEGFEPGWTILHAPEVVADPEDGTNGPAFIITDLGSQTTIIGGTRYFGQIKKAIFSVQNFRLPLRGILTMHAGASEGSAGKVAIHSGLSGTGKTTLSNTGNPVADDQIVVEIEGDPASIISNMEGGQYAKTDRLRRDKEPETYDAIRYGTVCENIKTDAAGNPDYDDSSITANGRVCYPLEYVPTAKASGLAAAPANITFLTADGFGVLPPVARLSVEGGMFHFAMGFTSKMPGTEKGITEPKPTFSPFYGKPFMPLKPHIYTDLLAALVARHGTEIWLVNTGWLGPNEPGRSRVDILVSKAIVNAVRDGAIDLSPENFWYDPIFKLHVPKVVPGVASELLDPRRVWTDQAAYLATANKLAAIFANAAANMPGLPEAVRAAGPEPRVE